MPARKVYLDDIALDEALSRFRQALAAADALRPMPGEWVPVAEAMGRVTAAPVWAKVSSPHYHAAAMDGYAVKAAETYSATETAPLRLSLGAQTTYVDTGDPLPAGRDAVIPIEQVQGRDDSIEILASVAPWQHVRPMGEDMVATELVLPENRLLAPADLGAIAGCGHAQVLVRRRPRLAIQPTGTELVAPGTELRAGDIIEYNSIMLAAQVTSWGAEASRLPPLPDNYARIRTAVETALADHDLVIVNAGSSAGAEDFTASIVEELGQLLVHGIAIRPGHPVILGVVRGKPIIGIPGYPVSAIVTSELIVKPLVYAWLGLTEPRRPTMTVTLTRKVVSPMGEEEFLRVSLGRVGDRVVATPLSRGAGIITSLVRADGIVRIPRFSEGLLAGAEVTAELLCSPAEIENTIVAIGSHDLTLDILASLMARVQAGPRLSSANVGSLGGLLALQRNEAHLAGSHLLDEDTGDYNTGYIRRLLPGRRIVLLGFVWRQQGLIVPPGNPKKVTALEDLLRDDVRFVNRQRGAGTRVLLDFELKRRRLDPARVRGYERQEFTHLAVAAAVASGAADCGLGILAAARALNLDFVPLFRERYDLVIPKEYYEGDLLRPLLEVTRSTGFQAQVAGLGGYDTSQMGEVLVRFSGS
ncbi:MAG: molybdopterin biosynthesis protein [Anaerolineae bacterium]|nr:molybdopterin biosynthesis protein [Anaerolineae bacterium]